MKKIKAFLSRFSLRRIRAFMDKNITQRIYRLPFKEFFKKTREFLANCILFVLPLSLIGYGIYQFNPAAAFITVGALIWIDINILPLLAKKD